MKKQKANSPLLNIQEEPVEPILTAKDVSEKQLKFHMKRLYFNLYEIRNLVSALEENLKKADSSLQEWSAYDQSDFKKTAGPIRGAFVHKVGKNYLTFRLALSEWVDSVSSFRESLGDKDMDDERPVTNVMVDRNSFLRTHLNEIFPE